MKDKEFRDLQAGIQVHVDRWAARFGLSTWNLKAEYERDGDEFTPARQEGTVRTETLANTVTNWPYMQATITFNCKALFDRDEAVVEAAVVHELSHILVAELRDVSDDFLKHEERAVTMLARAFLATRDDALQEVAKR